MKTLPLAVLLVALLGAGCNHKKDDLMVPASPAVTFPQLLTAGSWAATSYTEGIEDKTSQLAGYRFAFATDGQATATHGGNAYPGSWTWGGNSYYGTPADSKTVVFGNGHPLDRLSQSWIIASADDKLIRLDSANPAEDKHLTLGR